MLAKQMSLITVPKLSDQKRIDQSIILNGKPQRSIRTPDVAQNGYGSVFLPKYKTDDCLFRRLQCISCLSCVKLHDLDF